MLMKRILLLNIVIILTGFSFSYGGTSVAGTYRCWSYNVSGGAGSCRLSPPMILNPDGTYQMSSERGTYTVKGDTIILSESKIRGPGKLQNGNQIVFEYSYKGLNHTVTYLCQDCVAIPKK